MLVQNFSLEILNSPIGTTVDNGPMLVRNPSLEMPCDTQKFGTLLRHKLYSINDVYLKVRLNVSVLS